MKNRNEEIIIHPFPPVSDQHSRVLVLGTMPSPQSRKAEFYYAHPQNRFWRLLGKLFDYPPPVTVEEKSVLLLNQQIALWDVLASCRISGAADASIREPIANDLGRVLDKANIQAIFCNGGKAYELYRRLCQPLTGREAIPLPSTSPANCRLGMEKLTEEWRAILRHLG